MPIIVAYPSAWTLLGDGPLRVFPKGWRIGVIVSSVAPTRTDEPEDIVKGNYGQDYNVSLPVYAKPLDSAIVSIGVIQLAGSAGRQDSVPVNTKLPGISGDPYVGSVMTADLGTWSYAPTSYRYQFVRDRVAIPGAAGTTTSTTVTYTAVRGDAGTRLSIQVTGLNAAGPGVSVTSDEFLVGDDDSGVAMLFVPLVA